MEHLLKGLGAINLAGVTGSIDVFGTTESISFTVTYVDKDENELEKENVFWGEAYTKGQPVAPSITPSLTTDETGFAKLERFEFAGWTAQGTYSESDLLSVKQDMTFAASYRTEEVPVNYYVLERGQTKPAADENRKFTDGVSGKLKEFKATSDVSEISGIVSAPAASDFGIELNKGEEIEWYVVKGDLANASEWRVEGFIKNQKYNVTVQYGTIVDGIFAEFENVNAKTKAVTVGEAYEVSSPDVEGYHLMDAEQAIIKGTMGYQDIVYQVPYEIKTFTIEFIVDNESYGVSYVKYGQDGALIEYSPLPGQEFSGWDKSDKDLKNVKEDIKVYGTTKPLSLKVEFYVDGVQKDLQFVEYGQPAKVYTYETQEGETFEGWSIGRDPLTMEELVQRLAEVKENIRIDGSTFAESYKVEFFIDGVLYGEPYSVKYGTAVTAPSYTPEKGKTFSGWDQLDKLNKVTENLKIHGTTAPIIEPEEPTTPEITTTPEEPTTPEPTTTPEEPTTPEITATPEEPTTPEPSTAPEEPTTRPNGGNAGINPIPDPDSDPTSTTAPEIIEIPDVVIPEGAPEQDQELTTDPVEEEIEIEDTKTPEGAPDEEEIKIEDTKTPEGAPSGEELEIEDVEVPQGSAEELPQTGLTSPYFIYLLGVAVIALGAMVLKLGKRRDEGTKVD